MDAIIFDVDGTLWDSRQPVGEAWNAVIARELGEDRTLSLDQLTPLFGKTMEEIAALVFPQCGLEEQQSLSAQCFAYENAYLEDHPGRLYPGAAEALEQLAERWPLYIVSNCQRGYIEVMLRATGLAPLIRGHLCYGDTGADKGTTLRRLMEREGLTAPVYVGDTQGDADACARAGLPMVWASWGFGTVERPWRTASSLGELYGLLARAEEGAGP